MISKEKIYELISERLRIGEETQENWDYGIEQCWGQLIDALSVDINETIDFILNDCDDEEFFWLSECFEGLSKKVQSSELIEALWQRLNKVDKDTYDQMKFKDKGMREYIDYDNYVSGVTANIQFADGWVD